MAAHSSCLALAFLQVRALDAQAVRQPVSTNAYWVALDQSYRMRARNPGGQTLLGLFLENAHGTHGSPTSSVKVVVAWRRPALRHFQFPKER